MADAVDWEGLARQLGTLRPDGESGGSDLAARAIEILLGEERLRASVDYYVAFRPGFELARSVLWRIRPWSAMQRCYELYRTAGDIETRRSAVELLRVVADRRGLNWVGEFLDDPDEGVQSWGAGLLDQMLWSNLVDPEDCVELLERVRRHPNEQVRRTAGFIDGYLRSREEREPYLRGREQESDGTEPEA